MSKKELEDEFTLTLRKPIALGTGADAETYTQLELREPLADEMLEFSRLSAADAGNALRRMIAKISGVPLAVIGKMRARDFTRASNYLMEFMNPEIEEPDSDDDESEEGEGAEGK